MNLEILTPIEYKNTLDQRVNIPIGTYLVVRKDGKKHLEKFNGTGFAYNNNSIIAYYVPKID